MKIIHITQLLVAIAFSMFISWVAFDNYTGGRIDKGLGHAIIAFILFSFSIAHLTTCIKNRVSGFNVALFPILYIVMGLVFEYFSVGFRKNWAPSTEEEAFFENIQWAVISLLLIMASIFSVLYNKRET